MSIYTTLDQRAAKAAHQLIADLWDEWPGDDPAGLQPVVTEWLTETARNLQTAGIRGYRLVRVANTEADDYYQAMIDSPEKVIADAMSGRYEMARALLITLGSLRCEMNALSAWHNAFAGRSTKRCFTRIDSLFAMTEKQLKDLNQEVMHESDTWLRRLIHGAMIVVFILIVLFAAGPKLLELYTARFGNVNP